MTRRLAFASLAAALLLTAALPAHAYTMIYQPNDGRRTGSWRVSCDNADGFVRWAGRDIDWYVNNSSSEGASNSVQAALQAAMDSWTAVGSADHVLNLVGTTSDGWATDDRSTLLWASGNGCTGSCLALTALVLQSQVILESDITFNADYNWNTNGSNYDVEAVAAHELGHSLGIHHTDETTSPSPTMKSSYFGTDQRSLESDDKQALQCSEWRYCVNRRLKASGSFVFPSTQKAKLEWNTCLSGAYVDVFRDGVKVTTTENDGSYTDKQSGWPGFQAKYWVCDAGSTSSYDATTCSNKKTVTFW